MTHPDKPHSPEERAELLSAYLDGALSAAESAEVKDLIENNAAFKADYERLLKLKHLTHRVNGDLETSDDSLWQNIAAELKSDQQQAKKNTPAEIDVEFISAYYDGEIARDDSACVAFESRLYHCAESNRILGDIDVVSEAVRRFGHRLEESCTLDICGEVMATYHAELSQVAEADRPEPVMEEIADIEETKEWQTIAKNIQRVSQELEQQAPDVWPEIAKQLSTGHNVLPLKKPAAKKNAPIKIWGSVAAAVRAPVGAVGAMPFPLATDLDSVSCSRRTAAVTAASQSSKDSSASITTSPKRPITSTAQIRSPVRTARSSLSRT